MPQLRLALLLLATLATTSACSTVATAAPAVATGESFTLQVGASVRVGDGSLRYLSVVNDSRCPPDVQCIWAGDAVLAFQWQGAGNVAPREFQLHTHLEPKGEDLGGGRLTLLSLGRGPAPAAQLRFDPAH